ncbi:MAG: hypothetical protein Q8P30_00275 [Candidatus Uhrbacteria bacterium]|nr:hypothetical protein [Candidatus Uhrbacteria bacterium]
MQIRRRKHGKYTKTVIGLTAMVVSVILFVWGLQLTQMFSETSLSSFEENYSEAQRQINEGFSLTEDMEKIMPEVNGVFEGLLSDAQEAALLELARERALEAVAEEMKDEISVEEVDYSVSEDLSQVAEELNAESASETSGATSGTVLEIGDIVQ